MRLARSAYGGAERRGVYSVLVGNLERKGPLGRPRFKGVDNNKMDLQDVICGSMDWSELAKYKDCCQAFVKAVMNFQVS